MIGKIGAINLQNNPTGSFEPSQGFTFFEDWLNNTYAGSTAWVADVNGTGANALLTTTPQDQNHWGWVRLLTGTTNTGYAGIIQGLDAIRLGASTVTFEAVIQMPDLATEAEDFNLHVGLADLSSQSVQGDGFYFEYDRSTSTKWLRCTANNGTVTRTATTVDVAADTNVKLRATVTGGTVVDYWIDGAHVGQVTTNIPTGAGRVCGPIAAIVKTAGTTSRELWMDYFYLNAKFNTAR